MSILSEIGRNTELMASQVLGRGLGVVLADFERPILVETWHMIATVSMDLRISFDLS